MVTHWEKLLDVDFYTEGPAVDHEGHLYFTTLTGGAVMRCDSQGHLTEWTRMKCPNGQRILDNGNHLICDTLDRSIVEVDAQGKIIGYRARMVCANRPFYSPNDLIVDQFGGLYFTDSTRKNGQVFYIHPSGEQLLLTSELEYPNGLVLSPDGTKLYVAESTNNRIMIGELSGPGVLRTPFEVFARLPDNPLPEDPSRLPYTANLPDGLACDKQGRIWAAHYGMGALQVVGSDGVLSRSIPTGIPATSNLFFSPGEDVVYVTGGTAEPGPGCVHKVLIKNL